MTFAESLPASSALRVLAIAVLGALLGGCAGMERRPPPSIDEIVEMSKAGRPAEEIVRELQETQAVYPLTGSQIAKLHEQGVPDSVLDYMQSAYVERVRWQSRVQYGYYGSYWWDCYYCYPPRPMIVTPY